jgi:uncharacterized protein (TIGR02301 family)
MMRRFALALLACALLAGPARAQDRAPSQRQILTDLAYVIGQSHALRQACEGAGDQYWRERMAKLIDTEQPDVAFDRRLRESFNTGFVAGQSAFPACTPESRREAALAAARGRALAADLARAQADEAPGH